AGDSFAGAFLGHLARSGTVTDLSMRRAVLHGCVVASFAVEAFGVDRIRTLTVEDIDRRLRELHSFIQVDREASDRHLFLAKT
ncbi:MAG TPA: sugar kinase, partial [Chloroflexota bacterium]|nr:sugar kinase [Chloroflexota bacterium]